MHLANIHLLRGLTLFFIVLYHTKSLFNWYVTGVADWFLILLRDSTAIFLFISGYLFQYLSSKYNIKKYYINKLKYVLTPYVLISLPAIILFTFIQQRAGVNELLYTQPAWERILYFYSTGMHVDAYWFIPTILTFYFLSPIFYFLDKDGRFYWLLPIFIIISLNVPRASNDIFEAIPHFLSIYVLGMLFSKYRDFINPIINKKLSIFILLMIYIATVFLQYIYLDSFHFLILQKMVLAIFLMALLSHLREDTKTFKYLSLFASTSFGVFFIHPYIIFLTKKTIHFSTGTLIDENILVSIFLALLITLISVIIIQSIVKFTGKYSRYIIGS